MLALHSIGILLRDSDIYDNNPPSTRVPYDDDRIRTANFASFIVVITVSRGDVFFCVPPLSFSFYLSLSPLSFSLTLRDDATFFLQRNVDSFRLPMMFREQLCGSLGHEAWLLWGHRPIEPQSHWPRNAPEARPE